MQTDVLIEARDVTQDASLVARNWKLESVYVRRLITRLCDELEHARVRLRLCEQAFEIDAAINDPDVGNLNALRIVKQVAKANEFRSSIVSLIAGRAEDLSRTSIAAEANAAVVYALRELLAQIQETNK